jgi:8-oxo-dGTP diphosphatase
VALALGARPAVLVVSEIVFAAGGVVVRDGPLGPEIILVHRPRYGDWTLPKGKRNPGETDRETALREVREETGLDCELQDELPSISYVDAHGRPKIVRYWSMRVSADPGFDPTSEVDEIRWLSVPAAQALLTYERDRAVLSSASEP